MTNFCLECGIDMGPQNPRQLCGKTYCIYENDNSSEDPDYDPESDDEESEESLEYDSETDNEESDEQRNIVVGKRKKTQTHYFHNETQHFPCNFGGIGGSNNKFTVGRKIDMGRNI